MKAVDNEVGDVPSFAKIEEDPSYSYVNKSKDAYKYGFVFSYNQGNPKGKSEK
ncbi:hypothetical protein PGC35_07560 [Psychrobacillus sp. PGGUH221]|uniref:hypothetical protein n=1 Tax=Psychrobacillus sp. PGGUH221 TaxID=3020058 RepID=UPI0035C7579F